MNNGFISLHSEDEPQVDIRPKLQEEEAKLLRIIEAAQGLQASKEWSTLKTEVFETLVASLERDLQDEAKKNDPDPRRLNRITGELTWAKRFASLEKFEGDYRVKLQNVRLRQHGQTK